ncbi:hypothetical protein I4I73_11635, partial [Pseudonocardia sp. KRD-184]|nr:hypothetical protein [Pseudonocardia oceani]
MTASGALAVLGAGGASAAVPQQVVPVVPDPPTPVGGLLNGVLSTLQGLLPDLLGGTIPAVPVVPVVPVDTALVPVPGGLPAVPVAPAIPVAALPALPSDAAVPAVPALPAAGEQL